MKELSQKKSLFILIGIGVFCIVVLLFSLLPQQQSSNIDTNTKSGLSPTTIPNLSEQTKGWQMHTTTQYALSYPASWKPHEIPVVGGGTIFTARPTAIIDNDYFPRVDVEYYPTPQNSSIKKIADFYKSALAMEEDAMTFQGIPAITVSGILPFKLSTGDPQQKPIYKAFILFEKNGFTYVIKYAYYAEASAQSTEETITNILATIHIK